ncbi:MAG: FadR/GntR family transcriptional regulator [Opitutaceae bacterium]
MMAPPLAPVAPEALATVSVVDAVELHLKNRIRRGDLRPGDRLPSERKLQMQLGVSRLPLREGLARLNALGLIRIRHGQGAFVERGISRSALSDVLIALFPEHNPGALKDLIETRSFLEAELTALATLRAGAEDHARLIALAVEGGAALRDPAALADADVAFHRGVAALAGNAFMTVMYDAVAPHIRAFMISYARSEKERRAALARNRELAAAIAAGDPQKAALAARAHLQPCLRSLMPDRRTASV